MGQVVKVSTTKLPVIVSTDVLLVRGIGQREDWGDSPKIAPWPNEDVTARADESRPGGLVRATALPPHAYVLNPTASRD